MTRPKKILSTQTFTGYENCCPPFPFFFFPTLVVENNKVSRGGRLSPLEKSLVSSSLFTNPSRGWGKGGKSEILEGNKKKKKGKVKVVEKLCCVPHKTWFERRESRVPPSWRIFSPETFSLSLHFKFASNVQRIITKLIYPFLYLFAILKDYIDNISRIVVDLIRRVLFEEATRSWWWPATCNRESETEDATISGAPASDNW